MSDNALLNGLTLGLSFINLVLMGWLGLMVLLNTGQRTRGVWLAGSGLLTGALFFLSHTAILGLGPDFQAAELEGWWRLGWLPLVILPLNWYLIAIWYAGLWPDERRWPLPRGQSLLVGLVGLGLLGWLVIGWPLPAFAQIVRADFSTAAPFLLVYPAYTLLCTGLAVLALRQMEAGQDIRRRQAFQRQWRNVTVLAVGLGMMIGPGLMLAESPIYLLLAVTVVVTLFLALSHWRSYHWRAQYLRQLRPLVASPQLYDQLLATSPAEFDAGAPFTTLCRDVLRATFAQLTPLGPLAPLMRPLRYPAHAPQVELPPDLPAQFRAATGVGRKLDADRDDGVRWAIPLWSERGLIGVLLLGPKLNQQLYTQEELEIAQASAERLIDTRASAEIARRLLALQRERLVESQVLDRQTRRVIHDDVLPDLHAALLMLGSAPVQQEAVAALSSAHRQLANLLRDMPAATLPDLEKLGLMGALRRLVEGELANAFDHVSWHISSESEHTAQKLSTLQASILFYAAREALRNAARHGRGQVASRPLSLVITAAGSDELSLGIEDDGVGLANAAASGSGQGLALHSTMLAVVGGTLLLQSEAGLFTRVTLTSGPLNAGGGA